MRGALDFVRIHGMTYAEAAKVLDVSTKPVQRRLTHALVLLDAVIGDLRPLASSPAVARNVAAAVPRERPMVVTLGKSPMSENPQVVELLEEALFSGRSPEDVLARRTTRSC